MEIRFFAGAAEAAGRESLTMTVEPSQSVADVVGIVVGDDDRLRRVLDVSSLLLDGARVTDRGKSVGAASQLDVLPPFAGG